MKQVPKIFIIYFSLLIIATNQKQIWKIFIIYFEKFCRNSCKKICSGFNTHSKKFGKKFIFSVKSRSKIYCEMICRNYSYKCKAGTKKCSLFVSENSAGVLTKKFAEIFGTNPKKLRNTLIYSFKILRKFSYE